MPAYCLFDIRAVHDQAAMDRYVAEVPATVARHGGEYVVVGGPWQVVEGDWRPAYPVLIRFDDLEAANRWYESDDYRALKALRLGAVTSDAVFFAGGGVEAHAPARRDGDGDGAPRRGPAPA